MRIADLLSPDRLAAAGVSRPVAAKHSAPLIAAAQRFDISTPRRAAAFLGQCMHETDGLTKFEENLNYSTPARILEVFGRRVSGPAAAAALAGKPQALANTVYAGRFGNGDAASGDGWRYRGRGGGHLTFRDNYRDAGEALGRPYVEQPELVALPDDAALTFGWYWSTRGCNKMADAWDIAGITRAINPGMAGADRRVFLSQRALQAMQA